MHQLVRLVFPGFAVTVTELISPEASNVEDTAGLTEQAQA